MLRFCFRQLHALAVATAQESGIKTKTNSSSAFTDKTCTTRKRAWVHRMHFHCEISSFFVSMRLAARLNDFVFELKSKEEKNQTNSAFERFITNSFPLINTHPSF